MPFQNDILGGASGQGGAYTIDQSLRFNSADGGYFSKTLGAGNRKVWTLSFWSKGLKRDSDILNAYTGSNNDTGFLQVYLGGNGQKFTAGGWATTFRVSSNNFIDPSAWYHFCVNFDTTESTAVDRIKMYVNNELITAWDTNNALTENTDYAINSASEHQIGRDNAISSSRQMAGYLAEYYFIDGTVYAPSSFAETDEDTNQWIPKDSDDVIDAVTFGTNGFLLKFEDSADLGNDSSGEGNDWTVNNLTATDQVKDSPTNNFATFNPLVSGGFGVPTYKEGNLETSGTNSEYACAAATFAVSAGKWYWELYAENVDVGGSNNSKVGIKSVAAMNAVGRYPYGASGDNVGTLFYNAYNGYKDIDDTATSYGATYTNGDIIGIALDLDSGTQTIEFYKNNSSQGSITLSGGVAATTVVPMLINLYSAAIEIFNFGQDSSFAGNKTAQGNGGAGEDFYYTPPAGYKALNTNNLSAPSIKLAGDNFNTVLWTGTASSNAITGVGFQPDFTWIKNRSSGRSHALYDAVRGVTKQLSSDNNEIEKTETEGLKSFDSDGFTVGTENPVNESGDGLVSWNWLANGSGSSNTDGSITSTVSANTTAGFSIITYSGNETSGATVGHGLSVAPDLIIIKMRTAAGDWNVGQFNDANMGNTKTIQLNETSGSSASTGYWNNTSPTASVFTLGDADIMNGDNDYVAYCFHSVEGYSKFGVYTGNGNNDGEFIYTGFRPAYTMTKNLASAEGYTGWTIQDVKRATYNLVTLGTMLTANTSYAEGYRSQGSASTLDYYDIVSNGFKMRGTGYEINQGSALYLYIAFAEFPFKYSNAR